MSSDDGLASFIVLVVVAAAVVVVAPLMLVRWGTTLGPLANEVLVVPAVDEDKVGVVVEGRTE